MRTLLLTLLALSLLSGIALYLWLSRGPVDPPWLEDSLEEAVPTELAQAGDLSEPARSPVAPFQSTSTSRCIAQIRLLATSRKQRLELAVPQLDVELLEELRRIVRANPPEAAQLLFAAQAEPTGSETQCMLLLSIAWAGDETERVRPNVTHELAQFGAAIDAPLEAHDRVGLAAIHALELLGDQANLGQVAHSLVGEAWSEGGDVPVFPGMSSVRTWIALRGGALPLAANANLLERAFSPEQARFRVSNELWAAVARTAPEAWAETVFERAHAGEEHARDGLAALNDDRWLAELDEFFAVDFGEAHDSWCYSMAARGLIAMDSDASFASLERELARGGQSPELLAEALSSWRSAGSWQRLLQLGDRLPENEALLDAWRAGLDRGWDRVRLRRANDSERRGVVRILLEQATGEGPGAQAAAELLALESGV